MSDRSDIGTLLRDARNRFGWSLEDVAHRTRIPVSTLRNLEANDFAKFPSPAYAKSFLAQYAEHLGLDAFDWLDNFETGNSLANLDSYEYLKDHDEHLATAPLSVRGERTRRRAKTPRREKPKHHREPREAEARAERGERSAALQPLLVFLVTAGLVTGAVYGFMKLSDNLGEDIVAEEAAPPKSEPLKPLSGISESRPNFRDLSAAPRALPVGTEDNLVAGDPSESHRSETLNATPTSQVTPPVLLSSGSPPPRAVIVEE